MVHAEVRRQLMSDHVRRPVLDHALANPLVQRLRRGPHDVAARLVAAWVGHPQFSLSITLSNVAYVVNEDVEQRLRVAVLHVRIYE